MKTRPIININSIITININIVRVVRRFTTSVSRAGPVTLTVSGAALVAKCLA